MHKIVRHSVTCLIPVAALSCLTWLPAQAAVPVEGDVDALELLLAVQETNQTLFPRGELKVQVEESVTRIFATATVVWDSERTWWDYDLRRLEDDEARGEHVQARMIKTPQALTVYTPVARLVQVITDKSMGYHRVVDLRPDDVWFRVAVQSRSWKEMLDPAAPWATNVARFRVEQADDRIRVERHLDNGAVLQIDASLDNGGNIVRYQTQRGPRDRKAAASYMWREGSYDWAQDVNGNWYPTRYSYSQSKPGEKNAPMWQYTMRVLSFDPNPTIAADRFDWKSLNLPNGTMVEEVGGRGRRYRLGKEEAQAPQERLDELARRLRERGFAAPERAAAP